MKALILSAGFGTRLYPFTNHTPKPLFTIDRQPLLDITIRKLIHAGCESIIVNTHHLRHKIDDFIRSQKYPISVETRYEPSILGTGGAVKNLEDFWDNKPFLVINSDIITDIDLKDAYKFHLDHNCIATLALIDNPTFNNVSVDSSGRIAGFHDRITKQGLHNNRKLAFTGIHVIDTQILNYIPSNEFSNIVDIYSDLIFQGKKIKAYIVKDSYWTDIGTPDRYRKAVVFKMVRKAFEKAFGDCSGPKNQPTRLAGDGSDRGWHRFYSEKGSIVLAEHGIRKTFNTTQIDSFISIGTHLYNKNIPVPKIYLYDPFSGVVFLEDLGNTNLQTVVKNINCKTEIVKVYEPVIDNLVRMNFLGKDGFDISWTYQTSYYDTNLILEKECRYFTEAFLNGYININISFDDLADDFELIAKEALEFSIQVFIHRDMQSRNIMVKDNNYFFIDFQGGRIGPVQYDIASLLIDPYVSLSSDIQEHLLDYYILKLASFVDIDRRNFITCYKYCSIARNLQILGAFGYLSRVKKKTYFEQYIPPALKSLKTSLDAVKEYDFPLLKPVVEKVYDADNNFLG